MDKVVKTEEVTYCEACEFVIGEIPPITFENMDTPLQRANTWHVRMGRPNRKTMKAKVKGMIEANHPHINITVDEVDALPWNEAGVAKLSWEEEDRAKRLRERKEADLKRQAELEERAKQQREKAEADRKKRGALEGKLRKKAEERDRKRETEKTDRDKDAADKARNRLEKYCKELKHSMKDKKPSNEKKKLMSKIEEIIKWLDANPNAEADEYDKKQRELQSLAYKVDKLSKEDHKGAEDTKLRLENYRRTLEPYMSFDEYMDEIPSGDRKKLKDAIEDTRNWLRANPMAEQEEYEEKHEELEDIVIPILKGMAKARRSKKKDMKETDSRRHSEDDLLVGLVVDEASTSSSFSSSSSSSLSLSSASCEGEEKARQRLKNYCQSLKPYLSSKEVLDRIPGADRKNLKVAIKDAVKWLNSNPYPNDDEIKREHKALEDVVIPILERMAENERQRKKEADEIKREEAKNRQEEENEQSSRKETGEVRERFEKYCFSLKPYLIFEALESIPVEDSKKLRDAIEGTIKWLDANPMAEKEVYVQKHKELEEVVIPILRRLAEAERRRKEQVRERREEEERRRKEEEKLRLQREAEKESRRKEAADAKKSLENYCVSLEPYVTSKDFLDRISEDDRKKLKEEIDYAKEWLDANPRAEKDDYDKRYKALKDIAVPILQSMAKAEIQQKGTEKDEKMLEAEAENDDDDTVSTSSSLSFEEEETRQKQTAKEKAIAKRREIDEKKRAQKEARMKERQKKRELIEKLDKESETRELTQEEKRLLTEFYETRRLVAYHWWHYLNRPTQKKMVQMIDTIEDMKFANVKAKDVGLLPWLAEGFVVDVPKVSGWLATLDPQVIESVNSYM